MFRREGTAYKSKIRREGRVTEISVFPPAEISEGVVLLLISLVMFYGVASLALSSPVTVTSAMDLLKFYPALILAFGLFWMFRRLWEKEFAEQVVTVIPGKIIWAIKTRWWTRRREITGVHSISASAGWDGFGRVILKARGREYVVFRWILSEEAVRLANELQHAVKR